MEAEDWLKWGDCLQDAYAFSFLLRATLQAGCNASKGHTSSQVVFLWALGTSSYRILCSLDMALIPRAPHYSLQSYT